MCVHFLLFSKFVSNRRSLASNPELASGACDGDDWSFKAPS